MISGLKILENARKYSDYWSSSVGEIQWKQVFSCLRCFDWEIYIFICIIPHSNIYGKQKFFSKMIADVPPPSLCELIPSPFAGSVVRALSRVGKELWQRRLDVSLVWLMRKVFDIVFVQGGAGQIKNKHTKREKMDKITSFCIWRKPQSKGSRPLISQMKAGP